MKLPSLDGAMPAINLAEVADRAMSTSSAAALWGGIGIVGLGFVVRVLSEFIKTAMDDGYAPQYLRQVVIMVGFVALMAAYKPVVLGTVRIVSHLGSDMGPSASFEKTFATRMSKFNAYVNRLNEDSSFRANFSPEGITTRVFQVVTMLLYIGAQCIMFIIKAIQIFALAAIIAYGPVLIGVSTLGGIFASLGIAWFWALVEVSAWSFTVDVLLHVIDSFGRDIPEVFSYVQEMILAMTLMALLVATIPLTGALVRGHGASGLAQSASYLAGRAMGAGLMGVGAAKAAAPMAGKAGMLAGGLSGQGLAAAGRALGRAVGRGGAPNETEGAGSSGGASGSGAQAQPDSPPAWMSDKVLGRQAKGEQPDSASRGH